MDQDEQWRTIYRAPHYEISSLGRIRNDKTGRILKYSYNGQSPRVILRIDGASISFSVEQLVAEAFAGPQVDYTESWRRIEYFDSYDVSNQGRVRNSKTGRILRPQRGPDGRLQVTLNDRGYRTTRRLHLLVEEAFG